jgi:peptide/nickel transport system substrate-binding protein
MKRLFKRASATALAASVAFGVLGTAQVAQAQDKVLRVAHYGFNPQKGRFEMAFGAQSTLPLMAFADSMTYLNPNGSVDPGLATSWEVKDDTTWIFKIRQGVKFHNGAPMTAEQVVKNVEFLVNDDAGKTSISSRFLGLAGAKKIDANTVEITTKNPNPILDRWFALFRIMDADYQKDVGIEGFTVKPIGTGPFRVTNWTGEAMAAEKFADAWRPAKVDRLEITALTETAARVAALQSGQVDIAWLVSPDDIARLDSAGKKVQITQNFEVVSFKFNTIPERTTADNSPILDRRVRQAINYAINRDQYVKEVLGGLYVTAGQSAASTVAGHQDDIKPYPYDPERAKKLLAEAGYGDGLNLVMELIPTSTDYTNTSQFIATSLQRVGINLELRQIALADLLGKLRGQKPWDGHMWMGLVESFPTGDVMRPFATDSCAFFGAFICDKDIQPTIDAANTEFDPAKRAELVRKVVKHYHDEALISYMYERTVIDGLASNVKNYRLFNRAINWHEIELGG